MGSVVELKDGKATVVNVSGFSNQAVVDALGGDPGMKPLVDAMQKWGVERSRDLPRRKRVGGLLDRDRWLGPPSIPEKIRLARETLRDDVVGAAADGTEALAINEVGIYADDEDEEDVWNQILGDINFDDQMRKAWRLLFTDSQWCCVTWYDRRSYAVRGKTDKGNKRRKNFDNLLVPVGMTFLDTSKIIPVGNLMFGQERLAYQASPLEAIRIDAILAQRDGTPWKAPTHVRMGRQLVPISRTRDVMHDELELDDPLITQLVDKRYYPDWVERHELADEAIDVTNLFLLNPTISFRHTLTRPDFERFAEVRLESVFELLDLKAQLRQMDRAFLLGGPLRVDQRIATPDGWMPIGQAQVGDQVLSVDGQPTDIVGVFPQGVLPMYRVTFTDGAEVVCDGSHPWTVKDVNGKVRTITLDEIMAEGLFREWPNCNKRRHQHMIPVAAPLELDPVNLPLDPYLIGYMLGDGGMTNCTPKITCAEPENDQPWRDALPPGMTTTQYETREGFCNQYGLKGSRWQHNEVTEGLRLLGLWGHDHTSKYIPEECLWGSVAQRWALLQGLCDSDGHSHSPGGVEYTTASEKLALGVVQLAQSLGGVATINVRQPTGKARIPCYRVWIQINQTEAPFRIRRKADRWTPRKHPVTRAMHAIERIEDAEAICIKTARDDGLFLTEGMVVTHNTNYILLIRKGDKDTPAEQPEIDNLRAQAFTMASIPVVVSDHRLQIDIITPDMTAVLNREKYDTIDIRIFTRVWQNFLPTGLDREDPLKIARVVAKGLESRRKMLRRTFEREVIDRTRRMNPTQLQHRAKLRFSPAAIALAFDSAWASFLLDLRASNEISRDTVLSQFDLSQADEARMRQREAGGYDKVFMTQQPHGTPNPANPDPNADPNADPSADPPVPDGPGGAKSAQRRAGRRARGGGAAPGSGQGEAPRNPRHLANPSGPKEQDALRDQLGGFTKAKLIAEARHWEIVGRSAMSNEQLIEAIVEAMSAQEESE